MPFAPKRRVTNYTIPMLARLKGIEIATFGNMRRDYFVPVRSYELDVFALFCIKRAPNHPIFGDIFENRTNSVCGGITLVVYTRAI